MALPALWIFRVLTLRNTPAAGEGTMSVVVPVTMAGVLVRPGPMAPATLSIQLAWTWIALVVVVFSRILSVEVRMIIGPPSVPGRAAVYRNVGDSLEVVLRLGWHRAGHPSPGGFVRLTLRGAPLAELVLGHEDHAFLAGADQEDIGRRGDALGR